MVNIHEQQSPEQETNIYQQIDRYIEEYSANQMRKGMNPEKPIQFMRSVLPDFITIRNQRAQEVRSPEVQRAGERALKYLGYAPVIETCMDERTNLPIMYTIPHTIGTEHRTPGLEKSGLGYEESENTDTHRVKRVIDPASDYAAYIIDTCSQILPPRRVLTPHMHCLGYYGTEQLRGKSPPDLGAADNVKDAAQTIPATNDFIEEQNIVSGSKIARGILHSTFTRIAEREGGVHDFKINIRENYAETMDKFWRDIELMSEDPDYKTDFQNALTEIQRQLKNTYQITLGEDNRTALDPLVEEDIIYQSKLMVLNSYTYFKHSRHRTYREQRLHLHDGDHLVLTKGGLDPFRAQNALQISNRDRQSIAGNTKTGLRVLIDNRVQGRAEDSSGTYSREDFPEGIKLIFVKSELDTTEDDWRKLANADWKTIFSQVTKWNKNEPWWKANSDTFKTVVGTLTDLSSAALEALDDNRQVLMALFADQELGELISEGYVAAIPTFRDTEGNIRAVVRAFKTGSPRASA